MLASFSKTIHTVERLLAGLLIAALLFSFMAPLAALAETTDTTGDTSGTATSTPQTSEDTEVASSTPSTDTSTSAPTTTPSVTATSTESASSTSDGAGGTNTDPGGDGSDGNTDTDGANGTDGNTDTASSTDPCDAEVPDCGAGDPPVGENSGANGTEGADGPDGQESAPIPVISDELIGDEGDSEEEDVTGGQARSGSNAYIETGPATARGDIFTDANSINVRSEIESVDVVDYDTYTFNATGSNEAIVANSGVVLSSTGDNEASARNRADIVTGDAISTFNLANVINSNIVNSDGYIYLANKILEAGTSLDLSSFFFPDEAEVFGLADTCSLLSCVSEDIIYNFSQTNTATVTNDAVIEANTGENVTEPTIGSLGNYGTIHTGDAFSSANVINVVNTNIIDSNYRLLTFNAIGDLEGDLIMPTQELFDAFFSRPNGMTQLETVEDAHLVVDNVNDALVENNIDSYAETGLNDSTTVLDAVIQTGNGESESNVLNKINENTFGGDSMYLLIRVHGSWSGEVVGLPDGLTWEWTPDGIIIYNEDAEIAPSVLLNYDVDSYNANFTNRNAVYIENNLDIDAITGKNDVTAAYGEIRTGDAFASANVMNIANTNVIGTNWTMAIINILGDFDGNIAFSQTDLSLSGTTESDNDPLASGDTVSFSFVVTNNGDITATDVVLTQLLQNAHANSTATEQMISLGDLAPGESKQGTFNAIVDSNLPNGSSTVSSIVTVRSAEGDVDESDNVVIDEFAAYVADSSGDSSTTTDPGDTTSTSTATTTDTTTDTATSTEETTDNSTDTPVVNTPSSSGGGGGGGGGGGNKTKTKTVERVVEEVDPNAPPFLIVKKFADLDEDDVVAAGEDVDYTITVTNKGGQAYDAEVFDTLTNPIGSVISEQSWELGTILAGEVIELTYTTTYDFKTPSGKYTNTASIKAYRDADSKDLGEKSLKIDDAVYTVEVEGVPLAVGNVGVLAVFPGTNGTVSALIAWETSKSSLSQVFYSPKQPWSTFNESSLRYGYLNQSFKFSTPKDHHLMIIDSLTPGTEYVYRIDAHTTEFDVVSREHTFTVPPAVQSLALNTGQGFLSAEVLLSRVAGASTSVVPPAPKPYVAPAPKPVPEPEPVATTPEQQSQGIVGKVKDTFFGFFR